MQNNLIIINDGPYGTERAYNGLRMAMNLIKREGVAVSVFLIGDGVNCAKDGQTTPNGYYNIGRMLSSVMKRGGVIAA